MQKIVKYSIAVGLRKWNTFFFKKKERKKRSLTQKLKPLRSQSSDLVKYNHEVHTNETTLISSSLFLYAPQLDLLSLATCHATSKAETDITDR